MTTLAETLDWPFRNCVGSSFCVCVCVRLCPRLAPFLSTYQIDLCFSRLLDVQRVRDVEVGRGIPKEQERLVWAFRRLSFPSCEDNLKAVIRSKVDWLC